MGGKERGEKKKKETDFQKEIWWSELFCTIVYSIIKIAKTTICSSLTHSYSCYSNYLLLAHSSGALAMPHFQHDLLLLIDFK